MKILLERGDVNSDSSDEDGRTPLFYAAECEHEGIVNILLERGDVDSDSSDKYGQTPLSRAAQYGYEGIVKMLLERGDVNSDSSDKYGRTPLSYAAEGKIKTHYKESGSMPPCSPRLSGYEALVKILLERGDVNPESSDNDGRTPLMHAERSGKIGVVRLLSEPRPLSSRASQTSDLTLNVSSPARVLKRKRSPVLYHN